MRGRTATKDGVGHVIRRSDVDDNYRRKRAARAPPRRPPTGVRAAPALSPGAEVVAAGASAVESAVESGPALVSEPVGLSVEEAVESSPPPDLQTTSSGTVTPAPPQRARAKETAAFWPASSQASARQQAMESRNSLLAQTQPMSPWLQPAILVPLVAPLTHDC